MRHLIIKFFVVFALLLGMANISFALPACPSSSYYRDNCLGTYTFDSGAKYVGEFKNGQFHGQGTFTVGNGEKYVGQFKGGSIHGQGTYTYASGEEYVGEWKDNKKNGQGTSIWVSGEKYVGQWKDGKKHGQGTLTAANGDRYVGEWKDGKRTLSACPTSGYFHNCFGTYIWASGEKYVGQWKDGKKHGHGTLTTTYGNKYVGEWKDDKKNGQGTSTWVSGDKYVGEWKDNREHGQGTYTWPNGKLKKRYVGEYKNGLPDGHGIIFYVSGSKYVGELKDNHRHGQGTMTFSNGDKYVGEWKVNRKHGQGTYTWPNGKKYVGGWVSGREHGQGTKSYANKKIEKGIWDSGKFQDGHSGTKFIKVTKNPDINYVTVTLPQGIQFPVPKTWQNMLPFKGAIEDYLDTKDLFHNNVELGFAVKGYDETGQFIGQITLSFLKNLSFFGPEDFVALSEEEFEALAAVTENNQRKQVDKLGGKIVSYDASRRIFNGGSYHFVISRRLENLYNSNEERDIVSINVRYYNFKNSYSVFISAPFSRKDILFPIIGKFVAELKNDMF